MFAVLKTGGKQYKVQVNDILEIEKLEGKAGELVDFNEVITFGEGASITLGTPFVKGASVAAEIIDQKKGDKVIIFKKKRRHNYRRKRGHRQQLTVVRVLQIVAPGETRNVQASPLKEKWVNPAQRPQASKLEKKAAPKAEKPAVKKAAAPKAKAETKAKAAPAKKPAASKAKKTTKE